MVDQKIKENGAQESIESDMVQAIITVNNVSKAYVMLLIAVLNIYCRLKK